MDKQGLINIFFKGYEGLIPILFSGEKNGEREREGEERLLETSELGLTMNKCLMQSGLTVLFLDINMIPDEES